MKIDEDLFYKENDDDLIYWVETPETIGEFLFSFDKKKYLISLQIFPTN